MSQEHDTFLERQCAQEEAHGRVPSVIRLIAALREHAPMGLKQSKDTVEDFLERRERPRRGDQAASHFGILAQTEDRTEDKMIYD